MNRDRTPDRIEKQIELQAPVSRVWRALTDSRQFGEWFRVSLDAPFQPGEVATGQLLSPGCENLAWRAVIQDMEPEQYFAFTWHPYAVNANTEYSGETPTLVEFRLEKTAAGTRLQLTESGFSDLPDERRKEAFAANDGGWTRQMKNIADYLAQHP